MKQVLLGLVLSAALLAGCTGDAGSEDMEPDDTMQPEADTNTTAPNTAPLVALAADNTTVTVPADVTFTVRASDEDGDDLAWSLDADGDGSPDADGTLAAANGTYANASFTLTFDTEGTYNATVSVSDGEATANATIVITVEAPMDGGSDVEGNETVELEDRGWYEFDPATGVCYVKDYEELVPGTLYRSPLSGGDWFILEDNGIDGLQIEDNHPIGDPIGSGLDLPDCVDGDQVLL